MRRIVAVGMRVLLAPANLLLSRRAVPRQPGRDVPGPLFVIGLPRSGTTLVSQVLLRQFELGYLSNVHCYLYGAPELVELVLGRPLRATEGIGTMSRYGATAGWRGPSECGRFWYRFFPPTDRGEAPMRRPSNLVGTFARLSAQRGFPFLLKNVANSLRIPQLAQLFPNALFLDVQRAEEAVASSVLDARQALRGSADGWFSIRPLGWESVRGEPPTRQVAWQLMRIRRVLDSALADLAPDRRLQLAYEEFCAAPAVAIDRMAAPLARIGAARRPVPSPEPFRATRVETVWTHTLREAFAWASDQLSPRATR